MVRKINNICSGESDFEGEDISVSEYMRRNSMTYYWLYLITGSECYENSAWEGVARYKCFMKKSLAKTVEMQYNINMNKKGA